MKAVAQATNVVAACFAILISGCATLNPRTPLLLQGVTAGRGGWASGGCPPTVEFEYKMAQNGREASSPELSRRLMNRFPAGSPSASLVSYLAKQGFGPKGFCQNDQSISHMVFNQTGGSPLGPFPMFAVVAWKEGQQGRIVWTKGQVSFTGL